MRIRFFRLGPLHFAERVAHLLALHLGLRAGATRRDSTRPSAVAPALAEWLARQRHHGPPLDTVAVVASGPSAQAALPRLPRDALYLACNDSYRLCPKGQFVYGLCDPYRAQRYVVRGLDVPPLAVVYWTHFSGSSAAPRSAARHFAAYHATRQRAWPEFFACDGSRLEGAEANNRFLHRTLQAQLGVAPRLLNSGLMILQLGWALAAALDASTLHVAGLDLGLGSMTYFDGRALNPGQTSIVGPHVRAHAAKVLRAMQRHERITLINHSYFQPLASELDPV